MSTSFSDKKLDLSADTLSKDFHDDVSCIIERYIPEMKRALRPQLNLQSVTLGELQHCISILLYHSVSKAQALNYRAGLRAINVCFKHFMYLCSHVNNITPNAAIQILDGIESVLRDTTKLLSLNAKSSQKDLATIDDSKLDKRMTDLDLVLQALVNKAI